MHFSALRAPYIQIHIAQWTLPVLPNFTIQAWHQPYSVYTYMVRVVRPTLLLLHQQTRAEGLRLVSRFIYRYWLWPAIFASFLLWPSTDSYSYPPDIVPLVRPAENPTPQQHFNSSLANTKTTLVNRVLYALAIPVSIAPCTISKVFLVLYLSRALLAHIGAAYNATDFAIDARRCFAFSEKLLILGENRVSTEYISCSVLDM